MGKAPLWEKPGATNWIDARLASFVIGSRMKGGMGADEAVPFSDKGAAEKFAQENGGSVVAFAEVPKDYVLGAGPDATSSVDEASGEQPQHGHHQPARPQTGHAH